MEIVKKYNNIIVFHHDDADGIMAAMAIKAKYDNNLYDDNWDQTVTCIACTYGPKFNLQFFKDKVNENIINDMQNDIYMVDYSIQPYEDTVKFWNWTKAMGYNFIWIDHHSSAIESLEHLGIPGLRSIKSAGCKLTWQYVNSTENVPSIFNYVNDFDIWNKNSKYSWNDELYPLISFFDSLNITLNDNKSDIVTHLFHAINDSLYINNMINIGKYIDKYVKRQYSRAIKRIYEFKWNDYNCLVINSSFKGSTQFESHPQFKEADICVSWAYDGSRYNYGLYTINPNINIGELCKTFLNGGGHAGCGGGNTKENVFI